MFESSWKKHVVVRENGNFTLSKEMYLEPDWSFEDFLGAAGQRLRMAQGMARKAFHADGEEINDCMMIQDDDILIISDGKPLVSNKNDEGENENIGSYTIGEVLGSGGFGDVCVGINQISGERVALKFIEKSNIQSFMDAERAALEHRVLSSLHHRSIIKLISRFETSKHVILAFELMEGGNLRDHLLCRGHTAAESALSEEEARGVFVQIMDGLNYAHAHNVFHRDLKLENLFLSKKGSLEDVKIGDFGLADFFRPGQQGTSIQCGTLSFDGPEVFQRSTSKIVGTKLDVWAAGVILFALLCGRLPFDGSDLTYEDRLSDAVVQSRIIAGAYEIDARLSRGAKDLLKRMLCLDPETRATVPEVLNHWWMSKTPASSKDTIDQARKSSCSSAISSGLDRFPMSDDHQREGEGEGSTSSGDKFAELVASAQGNAQRAQISDRRSSLKSSDKYNSQTAMLEDELDKSLHAQSLAKGGSGASSQKSSVDNAVDFRTGLRRAGADVLSASFHDYNRRPSGSLKVDIMNRSLHESSVRLRKDSLSSKGPFTNAGATVSSPVGSTVTTTAAGGGSGKGKDANVAVSTGVGGGHSMDSLQELVAHGVMGASTLHKAQSEKVSPLGKNSSESPVSPKPAWLTSDNTSSDKSAIQPPVFGRTVSEPTSPKPAWLKSADTNTNASTDTSTSASASSASASGAGASASMTLSKGISASRKSSYAVPAAADDPDLPSLLEQQAAAAAGAGTGSRRSSKLLEPTLSNVRKTPSYNVGGGGSTRR